MIIDSLSNPDFARRYYYLQPNANRERAAFYAPIDSENMSLRSGLTQQDIEFLYSKYDTLAAKIEEAMEALYDERFYDFSDTGENLEEYGLKLSRIRQEIAQLKKVI